MQKRLGFFREHVFEVNHTAAITGIFQVGVKNGIGEQMDVRYLNLDIQVGLLVINIAQFQETVMVDAFYKEKTINDLAVVSIRFQNSTDKGVLPEIAVYGVHCPVDAGPAGYLCLLNFTGFT